MTYDVFGARIADGPTIDVAVRKPRAQGKPGRQTAPRDRLPRARLDGVTQKEPADAANGPAPGAYEQGIEYDKAVKEDARRTAVRRSPWWAPRTPSAAASGGATTPCRRSAGRRRT
ncbi:hypothetical protein [Streptomyces sp. NPDC048639]|uniref:hypothetical protein n=1 Tax=Streptomyces sp. NPDC048639 TaxID=3365581 RepID=UPI003722275A